jgi:hypothetical protein
MLKDIQEVNMIISRFVIGNYYDASVIPVSKLRIHNMLFIN